MQRVLSVTLDSIHVEFDGDDVEKASQVDLRLSLHRVGAWRELASRRTVVLLSHITQSSNVPRFDGNRCSCP